MRILVFFTLLLIALPAYAKEIAGVMVNDTLQTEDGTTLQLNGAGVRSKLFMDIYIAQLKFPKKVLCRHLHERGREGIYDRFAWMWANQLKILFQCCLGNQSPDIGKGEMISAFDRVSSRRSFVQVAGINPGK